MSDAPSFADLALRLAAAELRMRTAAGLLEAAGAEHRHAAADLDALRQAFAATAKAALPLPDVAPSEHRSAHRMGVPARLDTDPELRAFVSARLASHTFQAIADEVAAAFPPARRVRRSAIHAWWKRTRLA